MKQILNIAFRELTSFFDSLMAYILIVMFLGFSGFFTWIYGEDIFLKGQASLDTFMTVAYWSLFFFIPSITMRSIAGEMKAGTLELLLTKPISDWQLIIGKYLSILLLITITLLPTLIYYISLVNIGPVDHGAVILAYLGLILMSSVYISLGVFTSTITYNPLIAYLFSMFIGLFLHVIFDYISIGLVGSIGKIFSYWSLSSHFESISRGVLDSKDIIYFLSITLWALYAGKEVLASRNMND